MVKLGPIEQEDFERFIEREIRGYAEEHVKNGNWPTEGALERARKELEHHLPDGVHSKDQYLYSILDDVQRIGFLWVQVKDRRAFIFDFVIEEAFRGKGYGKQALSAMDDKPRSMNVETVELHVFGDNIAAQELYKKAGFQISGIHMNKKLHRE